MYRVLAGSAALVLGVVVGCSSNDESGDTAEDDRPVPRFDRDELAARLVELDERCRDQSVAACGELDALAEPIFAETTSAFHAAWREADRETAESLSTEQVVTDPAFNLDQLLANVPEEANLDCSSESNDPDRESKLDLGCWQTVSRSDGSRMDVYLIFRIDNGVAALESWRPDI